MTATADELVFTVLTYVALGVIYGASGYVHSIANGKANFDVTKFGKTVAVGAVAGVIVALQGEEFDAGAFEVAMAVAVPVVDQIAGALLTGDGSGAPELDA